jgi:hypothetical protein
VPDTDYSFRFVGTSGGTGPLCYGPTGGIDCNSSGPYESFHTLGGVVQSDYGTTPTATDLSWNLKSDAWAFNGKGNDSQLLYTAGNPDPSRSGGYRTLRILGTRTAASASAGATTLAVNSTAGFPTYPCNDNGSSNSCGLLVNYTDFTNGQKLKYTGISGNTFTGVTGISQSVSANASVIAQSAYDAHHSGAETRTQLINNSCSYPGASFYCYPSDSRSLTTFWVRFQSPSPLPAPANTTQEFSGGQCVNSQVAQIKEELPDASGWDPIFGIVQSKSNLAAVVGGSNGIPRTVAPFPKAAGWMKVGLDIAFSTDPQKGKWQFLVDNNADGNWDRASAVVSGSKTLLTASADEWTANVSFGPYQTGCVPPISNDYANWQITAKPLNAGWQTPIP